MQHAINRQIIELGLRSEEAAFRLQQQVSEQFHQRVMAVLGRVFDELGPEGELISFDRLIVDLGSVSYSSIEDGSWTDELYDKLTQQASTLIKERGAHRQEMRRPIGAGIVEQWLYYMRTGWLPWNVKRIEKPWLESLLAHLAADFKAAMMVRECIAGNAVVPRRIALQHDEKFLVNLAEVLTARNQSALPVALAEMELIRQVLSASPARESKILWMQAIRLAAESRVSRSSLDIVRALLAEGVRSLATQEDVKVDLPVMVMIRKELAGRLPFCEPLLKEIEAQMGEQVVPVVDGRMVKPPFTEWLAPTSQETIYTDARQQRRALEEGIHVPYAGMVLLHPFLPAFIRRVGLVKENEFVDQAAQRRCLPLLQYVVTGVAAAPEYELVMTRILCAFPLAEPVEQEFEPTAAEAAEAAELLDACLAQWDKLGNTSRAGLQQNFLQRAGRLMKIDDRLRLDVEQSSIDVLLDYLPWGIGMVKLPWMKEILYVNWR